MATGPADVTEPPEVEETGEELSRKKKSKFQTFKNFFAKKKKRKEPSSPMGDSTLKPSQSSSDVSTPNLDSSILHLPPEPGSKGSMGNKALSHDSVFIFDSSPEVTGKASSQENLPGKVKALQLQLQQNLRLGSPPLVITKKKTEDAGAVSEDDGLPRSPPEISTLHDVLTSSASKSSNPVQRHSSLSLGGTDSEDDQVPSEASSRAISPLSSAALVRPASPACRLLPTDFNSPASPLGCLDTSAAKHRIAINPRKQKAFTSKTQNLPVEKERCLLGTAEGKMSHAKLLEELDSQENSWKGLLVLNSSKSNESWTLHALPLPRSTDPLRYSWNAGPRADGVCISALETRNLIETDLQASETVSSARACSPPSECEEEMKEEGCLRSSIGDQADLELNPQSSGKEAADASESVQTGIGTVGLRETSLAPLCGVSVENDSDVSAGSIQEPSPKPSTDHEVKNSKDNGETTHVDRGKDRPGAGISGVTHKTDSALCLPQFPSSALDTPSEAEQAAASEPKNSLAVKEDAGCKSGEMGFQPSGDCTQPTPRAREASAILDANINSVLPQSSVGKKQFHPMECHDSFLNENVSVHEAGLPRTIYSPSVGGLATSGAPEVASASSPPDKAAGEDQSGSIKIREESQTPDGIVKTPSRSGSAKPVRFTIAPAWQRSLSGGSASVDGSRSSPSSPIKPELFEGIPQLDTAVQGCVLNSLERLDRNPAASLNSAPECPNEEAQGRESPFGVKLRRTSSLLKYQAEQQHHEAPRPVPSPAIGNSTVSVRDEPKPPTSGKPLQNLPGGGTKPLVSKPSLKEERDAVKAKPEEAATKQPTSKPPEHRPAAHLENPSSEPAWISMAKLKQKGFQGNLLAKGQKQEEKILTKTGSEEQKPVTVSQQEKQVNPAGENLLKKKSAPHLCSLENKAQLKMTTTVLVKEAPWVEKEMRPSPTLPMSTCSPAEPPWLSLAKKKAKAWSEMPQIVQ
ncbi:acrosomal protein KIAA1210 homolog [Tiliqua scincoides]|uniref:acrosomal protein KIAA1210 homolog n=1 Tax=Tiliqua scincoides TaxID=71010 RepID=UPI003461D2CA